jgi:hypothetical protein
MEIKRNSLRLRLYTKYTTHSLYDLENDNKPVNFCQYARGVFLGVGGAVLVTMGCALLALGWMQAIGTIGLWLFTDNPLMLFITDAEGAGWLMVAGDVGAISFGIQALLGIICGLTLSWVRIKDEYRQRWYDYKEDRKHVHEKGFIATLYDAWKNKYCPMMTLEEDNWKERMGLDNIEWPHPPKETDDE